MFARLRAHFGLLVVLLVLAALPVAPPSGRAADLGSTFVVTGSLLLPGGFPTSDAPVWVAPLTPTGAFDYGARRGTATDFDGDFTFSGLAVGRYGLLFYPPSNAASATILRGATFELTVASPPTTNLGAFILPAAAKRLNGTVTLGGSPVGGAWVYATSPGGTDTLFASSGGDGAFSFGLEPGRWQIFIGNPPGASWQFVAQPSEVSFAQDTTPETKSLALTVQPTVGAITGQIVQPDGAPLSLPSPGAFSSQVSLNSGSFFSGRFERLDSSGSFSIPVVAGEYTLNVAIDEGFFSTFVAPPAQLVRAGAGTTDLGQIRLLSADAVVEGTVRLPGGAPASGLSVEAVRAGFASRRASTDGAGRFRLRLAAGSWELALPDAAQLGFLDAGTWQLVSAAGGVTTTADFQLAARAGAISGRFVAEGSPATPISDVAGLAYARDPETGEIVAGAEVVRGAFTLSAPAGRWLVGVELAQGSRFALLAEAEVTIPTGAGADREVTLTLGAVNATIVGGLVDRAGVAITGVAVDVALAPAGDGGAWQWQSIDPATGTYEIPVRAGTWLLSYEVTDPDEPFAAPVGVVLPVTVAAGATATQNAVLQRLDGVVRGRVVDEGGAPLPEELVFLGSAFYTAEAFTDASGEFAIPAPLVAPDGSAASYLLEGDFSCIGIERCFLADEPRVVTPTPRAAVMTAARQTLNITLTAQRADGGAILTGRAAQGGTIFSGQIIKGGRVAGTSIREDATDAEGRFEVLLSYSSRRAPSSFNGELVMGSARIPVPSVRRPSLLARPPTAWQTVELPVAEFNPLDGLPAGAAAEFDNAGGWSALLADGTRVEIPPAAVPLGNGDGTRVRVRVTPTINIFPTAQFAGGSWYGYEIALEAVASNRPIGEDLLAPARITLRYGGRDLVINRVRESRLRPALLAGRSWLPADGFVADLVNNQISFQTRRTGVWALVQDQAGCADCIYLPQIRR